MRIRFGFWMVGLGLAFAAMALRAQTIVPASTSYGIVNAFPNLTFEDPVAMRPLPGTNQLVVAGRQGQMWIFTNSPGTTSKAVFLDISAHVQGWSDSGLLGFAFHPQFGQAGSPNRGYVYVWYNYTPGPIIGSASAPPNYNTTPTYDRLSRFTVPDGSAVADPNSEYVLINQFDRDIWHNGGDMFFGSDGFLWVVNGDEGGVADAYNHAQDVNTGLFGGVLRIDVDKNPAKSHAIRRQPVADPTATVPSGWPATYTQGYYIPNDNPWQDPTGRTLEEFWAIGFRSPHRMTLDPVTGNVWIGDVGQSLYEEVDLLQKGGNYGWPFKEGFAAGPLPQPATVIGTVVDPVYAYYHYNKSGCVIGGYVYRGSKFPELKGLYIFGDYDANYIWSMNYSGSGTPVVNYLTSLAWPVKGENAISSFGQDANNELYILTIGANASIYTLAAQGTAGQIYNLSARASAGTGLQQMDAGFVTKNGNKQVLIRGVGPTLSSFGVPEVLTDTQLQLQDASGNAVQNNSHWCTGGNQSALTAAATACGAFPLPVGSLDSALTATVTPGSHTAQVGPAGSATAGIALAEVYDLSPASSGSGPQLVNLSCRSPVSGTDSAAALIGGFVIGGNSPVRLLIRGVGPGLAQFGVSNYLAAPILTLYDAAANTIFVDDQGWGEYMGNAISAVASSVGAFPLTSGSNDAAILITLNPGSYTAEITSGNLTNGVALLELYVAP